MSKGETQLVINRTLYLLKKVNQEEELTLEEELILVNNLYYR